MFKDDETTARIVILILFLAAAIITVMSFHFEYYIKGGARVIELEQENLKLQEQIIEMEGGGE